MEVHRDIYFSDTCTTIKCVAAHLCDLIRYNQRSIKSCAAVETVVRDRRHACRHADALYRISY